MEDEPDLGAAIHRTLSPNSRPPSAIALDSQQLHVGKLTLDYGKHMVYCHQADTPQPIALTAKEFQVQRPGQAAQAIMQAHLGTIQVQSEPGKGSIFTVHLPIIPPCKG